MSCDPRFQPRAASRPVPSRTSALKIVTKSSSEAQSLKVHAGVEIPCLSNTSQSRSNSWLSLSRGPLRRYASRSRPSHLSKSANPSSVNGKNISTPVLTGTTNMQVATAEGIDCGSIVCEQHCQPNSNTTGIQTVESKFTKVIQLVRSVTGRNQDRTGYRLGNSELEERRHSTAERSIARRRAETINLYREKINQLTGHGHVRRKTLSDVKVDEPLLGQETSFLGIPDTASDFEPKSLTRSFASAIEKLDFLTVSTSTGISKSRSSVFNFKKRDNVDKDSGRTKEELCEHTVNNNTPTTHQVLIEDGGRRSPRQLGITASRSDTAIFDIDPGTVGVSNGAATHASNMDPLRMHGNVNDFVRGPPKADLRNIKCFAQTETDTSVIDDAPIYSPSLGDLKQYAQTPSASSMVMRDDLIEPETPTHMPGERKHTKRVGLKKSRSGLALLNKLKALGAKDINLPDNAVRRSRSIHFGFIKPEVSEATTSVNKDVWS